METQARHTRVFREGCRARVRACVCVCTIKKKIQISYQDRFSSTHVFAVGAVVPRCTVGEASGEEVVNNYDTPQRWKQHLEEPRDTGNGIRFQRQTNNPCFVREVAPVWRQVCRAVMRSQGKKKQSVNAQEMK